MIRVHVICEGQTEEDFVKNILLLHFMELGIELKPSCIGQVGQKGGRVNIQRLELDVRNRFREKTCYCTTLIDFYGLPSDFPGKSIAAKRLDISDKQNAVIEALSAWAIERWGADNAARFLPYVQMHEFEALLFSDPVALACEIGASDSQADFIGIRNQFSTPEWINDNPLLAPSKRIETLHPRYNKPADPVLAAKRIGLEKMRSECHLFSKWLTKLESLGR